MRRQAVRRQVRPRRWRLAGAGAMAVALALLATALVAPALIVIGRVDVVKTLALADIDSYPARTKVTGCADPLVGKPGVVAFRAMILSQVGGRDDGLAVCKHIASARRSYSDHADGRAWDWHASARDPTDSARVDRVLNWLLRPDDRGNRNAMARRVGITYIIWNHRYYRVSADDARWVPYTATSDPHNTHVHFSFSVAGATRQTSWWSKRGPLTWLLPGEPNITLAFGEGPARAVAGDWDGDGRDTPGAYNPADRRFSLRDGVTSNGPEVTTPPTGPFGATPIVGDWAGTGHDEVGVYEPLARRFSFYSRTGAEVRPSVAFGGAGDLPVIGDWNADGVDDIGTYSAASQKFSLLLPGGSVRTEAFGRRSDTPISGDWNGDGTDDIGVFRPATRTFFLATRTAAGVLEVRSADLGSIRDAPVIGDWDGDGIDDHGVVTTG